MNKLSLSHSPNVLSLNVENMTGLKSLSVVENDNLLGLQLPVGGVLKTFTAHANSRLENIDLSNSAKLNVSSVTDHDSVVEINSYKDSHLKGVNSNKGIVTVNAAHNPRLSLLALKKEDALTEVLLT